MANTPTKDLRRKLGFTQASNFFLTFWAPILGSGPSMLYIQLRKRCIDDNPFRATSRTLMSELGISDFHTFNRYQKKLEMNRLIIFKVVDPGSSHFSRETCYFIKESPPFLEPHHIEKLPSRLQKFYNDFIVKSDKVLIDQILDFTLSEKITERSIAVKTTAGTAVEITADSAVKTTAGCAVEITAGCAVETTAYNNIHLDINTTRREVCEKFPKFKGLGPDIFAELIQKYSIQSVVEAVEVLSYQYRDVEIRCPSALLKKYQQVPGTFEVPGTYLWGRYFKGIYLSDL